jgi:hypothetical protein
MENYSKITKNCFNLCIVKMEIKLKDYLITENDVILERFAHVIITIWK